MTDNIKRFYEQIDSLKQNLVRILEILGDEQNLIELEKYYVKLQMVKFANVRLPIEIFYEHGVLKYHEKIRCKDETFFIQKIHNISEQKTDTINATTDDNLVKLQDDDLLIIGQIKHFWNKLNDKSKENIWKYITVICILSERVVKPDTNSLFLKN